MFILIFLIYSLVFTSFSKEILYAEIGEGFIYHIEYWGDKPFNCTLNRGTKSFPISGTSSFQTQFGETISPYSSEFCGIRVRNINEKSIETRWTLVIQEASLYKAVDLDVRVLPRNEDQTTNLYIYPGEAELRCQYSNDISCLWEGSLYERDSCKGDVVIRHQSPYSCNKWTHGRMTQIHEDINVKLKQSQSRVVSHMVNDDDFLVMSCRFSTKPQFCRAELPNRKQQLLIKDNLLSGRYSTFDTKLTSNLCTLEIEKPLEVNEFGLWRIYGFDSNNHISTGCIFYVGDESEIISEQIKLTKQYEEIHLNAKDTNFEIICEAPFVVRACYLTNPMKSVFLMPNSALEITQSLGLCRFSNQHHIQGDWVCGMIGDTAEKKFEKTIHVTVDYIQQKVTSLTDKVTASIGDTVDIVCRHGNNYPIESCAFTDPNGNVHVLFEGSTSSSSSNYQYYGEGFNQGFCGIKIHDVGTDDFGAWTCFITKSRSYSSTNDISFTSYLVEDTISTATTIGIAFGVGVLGCLALAGGGYLVYKKYYQRTGTGTGTGTGAPLAMQID